MVSSRCFLEIFTPGKHVVRKGGIEGGCGKGEGFGEHALAESGLGIGFGSQFCRSASTETVSCGVREQRLKPWQARVGLGTIKQDRPQQTWVQMQRLEAALGCPAPWDGPSCLFSCSRSSLGHLPCPLRPRL